MRDEALRLASLGYPVFPCTEGSKRPATQHGFHDASTDEAVITSWWSASPRANIAIATARLTVIDVDDRSSEWFLGHEPRLRNDAAAIAETPRGGLHFYFATPAGVNIRSGTGKPAAGIDVRAEGGYVVAPPSVGVSGVYNWVGQSRLDKPITDLAAVPGWLFDELTQHRSNVGSLDRHGGGNPTATTIREGARSSSLTSIAGSLRRRGLAAAEIQPALAAVNHNRCNPPLPSEEVAAIAASVARYPADADVFDGRKPIRMAADEHRVADEVVQALSDDPTLFQREGRLVRVDFPGGTSQGVTRGPSTPVIALVSLPHLRDRISHRCDLYMIRQGGQRTSVHPTAWLTSVIDARGRLPNIRELIGISTVPILRPDGSIWQTPGYDQQTSGLYIPNGDFPLIPDVLEETSAGEAALQLVDVVRDFRFEAEHHQSAFLAAILTVVGRYAFAGATPLFLIDANVRGAGKGLLAQTIGRIALGHELSVSSYSHDSEELRKRITALALAGDRIVLLDNVEGRFGNDALDRALTTTRWRDRVLGRSEQVDLPLIPVWLATGNNVEVAADTARRIVHIRLDVMEEYPEDRCDFAHPDLLGWITANRAELLVSAITILATYLRLGCPPQGLRPFGSFEGWSNLIRNAVVWLGMPDPCLGRERLVQFADTTADTLALLLRAWRQYDPSGDGIVLSRVLADLYPTEGSRPDDDRSVLMRTAIEQVAGGSPGRAPSARVVGNRLKTFRRRVQNGFYIDIDPTNHDREGRIWRWHEHAR